jgi:hypothetical protein
MYAMYYASMLQCWQLIRILVRTNHPCLRVGRHTEPRHCRLAAAAPETPVLIHHLEEDPCLHRCGRRSPWSQSTTRRRLIRR